MFILQPGTGLGFTGSKQIALGLGGITPVDELLEYHGGGGFRHHILPGRDKDLQERILRDDMDIVALVVAAIESGIIE